MLFCAHFSNARRARYRRHLWQELCTAPGVLATVLGRGAGDAALATALRHNHLRPAELLWPIETDEVLLRHYEVALARTAALEPVCAHPLFLIPLHHLAAYCFVDDVAPPAALLSAVQPGGGGGAQVADVRAHQRLLYGPDLDALTTTDAFFAAPEQATLPASWVREHALRRLLLALPVELGARLLRYRAPQVAGEFGRAAREDTVSAARVAQLSGVAQLLEAADERAAWELRVAEVLA